MKKTPQENIQQKVARYLKAEGDLLVRHKLHKRFIVSFPRRKRTPWWGKVGMWLVRTSGGIIDTMYTDASGSK